jgi:capsular exopolysaccharide synthesis family protein
MERIKQALEKARQEREDYVAPPAAAVGAALAQAALSPLAPPPPAPPRAPPRPATPSEPSSISYSQTRSFRPAPEVLRRNRILVGPENPTALAAFKVLRTQVLQRMKERGWKALAVTSPGAGEGKTVTAVNLAISLAREVNHTVLLVDLDLRNPSVHRCLGYEPEQGISDIVLRQAQVADALVNPGLERLVILPGHEPVAHSSEVLSSPAMVALVQDIKHRYPNRMVIFDMPPVLSADDALTFAPYVDAVLLVVEEGKTKRDDILRAVSYLRNTELIGTVLNRSEEAVPGYY